MINKNSKRLYTIFHLTLLLICSLTVYCQNTNEIKTFQELFVDKERAFSLKVTHSNTPSSKNDSKSECEMIVLLRKSTASNYKMEIEIPLNEFDLDTLKLNLNITSDFVENQKGLENLLKNINVAKKNLNLIVDIFGGINFLIEVLTIEIDKEYSDAKANRNNLDGNLNFNVVRSAESIQLIETFTVSNDSYKESLISKMKENSEKYNFDDQETNHALNLIINSESKFLTELNVFFNTKTYKLESAKRIITQQTKFQNLEKSLSNTIIVLTEK
ncbi:MAG TPA: hypothetical protein PKD51_08890 [Saprospiraceae bacterium]|nr:hypothetical protein [Saprospiraceae bacterium]